MFEEYTTNRWIVGKMEHPYGRGINFSIYTPNIEELYIKIKNHKIEIYKNLTTQTYKVNEKLISSQEFIIQDPDGYLLRFTN